MSNTMFDLEQTITRMKSEILLDVLCGYLPADVSSFSQLHDFVDANAYGGFCDDETLNNLIDHFGGRDENDGFPDELVNFINAAQDAINEWLKVGGIAKHYEGKE